MSSNMPNFMFVRYNFTREFWKVLCHFAFQVLENIKERFQLSSMRDITWASSTERVRFKLRQCWGKSEGVKGFLTTVCFGRRWNDAACRQ